MKVKNFYPPLWWHLSGYLFPPTAVAAQSIDWTISQTIIGPKGEDLPLRVGQGDEPGSVGFGLSHIKDSHGGFVPATTEIDTVLHNAPTAKAA